jgi:hypothetical protein
MKKHILFCLILVSASRAAMSQAVFAPVKGAEWRYYFKSSYYEAPYFQPREGIVTVRYSKDTTINGVLMKKMDRSDDVKYRLEKDTVYYRRPGPLFMTQRNDSVFTLTENGLVLSFVYKAMVGALTNFLIGSGPFSYSLRSSGVSILKPNNSNIPFEKYSYKSIYSAIDIQINDSLFILDRIGPLNSDITMVESQGVGEYYFLGYSLICYKDNDIGEVIFSERRCDSRLVSVFENTGRTTKDFSLFSKGQSITISLQDNEKNIVVNLFDSSGRSIRHFSQENGKDIDISLSQKGLFFVQVSANGILYKTKKINIF